MVSNEQLRLFCYYTYANIIPNVEFIAVDGMEDSVATLNDDYIIQDVLNHNNKLSAKDNSDTEEIKISLKEGEDALRKSLSFLEQQDNDNINIRVNDLSVVRRLISQVSCYRKLQYKQSSLENFFDNSHINIHNKITEN